MTSSSAVLNGLRDAIADIVEGTARSRKPAESSPVVKAVESCLSFRLLPRGGASSALALWQVFVEVDWASLGGPAIASGPSPGRQLANLFLVAGRQPDDHRSRLFILLCLESHLILPAFTHLCGPASASVLAAHYSYDSIVRDHDAAARFLALLAAVQGVSFCSTAATPADLPAVPACILAESPARPPLPTLDSTRVASTPQPRSKDEDLFLAPGHAPLHAFWDDLTVAAESGASSGGGHGHGMVLESISAGRAATVSSADLAQQADTMSRRMNSSSILGDSVGDLPAHLLLLPHAARVQSAGADHPAPGGTPAPSTSAWDFAGSLSAVLSFPYETVRRLLGGGEAQPTQPQPSHGSVFGMPLAAVVRDSFHCAHAALDYRLSVPELVHSCSRMLRDLARAASPESASPPHGLGIISPPVTEVLELASAWDATRSLPLPMASQTGTRGGASATGASTPARSVGAVAPWEHQTHAIAQLLRYYVLRLPQRPISSEHSSALAACGSLPHRLADTPSEPLTNQEAASSTPRMRSLRAFINGLPVEVKALLCELVPLLGWMCGVSQDGVRCGPSGAPLTAVDEAHLAALSHIWAAALVAPPASVLSSRFHGAQPRAPSVASESPSNLEAHVRGSVDAVACLIVSWRYCLSDALEERAAWEGTLLRRLHRLTVTHYMLCAHPLSDNLSGFLADGSSGSLDSASGSLEAAASTPKRVQHHERQASSKDAAAASARRTTAVDGEMRSLQLSAATLHSHVSGTGVQRTSVPSAHVLLEQLWQSLQPAVGVVTSVDIETGFQPNGPFWRSLGFQSGDPLLDASRSRARSLGLLCVAYMCEAFQLQVWAILARMHGNERAAQAWTSASTGQGGGKSSSHLHAEVEVTDGSAAGRPASFFPFASCVLLIVRRLAEALHLHGTRGRIDEATGGAAATLDAGRLSAHAGTSGHRVFSPLVVATLHRDLWVLTEADDESDPCNFDRRQPTTEWSEQRLDESSTKRAVAPSASKTLAAASISAAFARTVCLAAFILEERWHYRRAIGDGVLSQLVVFAVHDALALLPVVSSGRDPMAPADAVSAVEIRNGAHGGASGGLDVIAALALWRRRTRMDEAGHDDTVAGTGLDSEWVELISPQLLRNAGPSFPDRTEASDGAAAAPPGALHVAPLASRSSILSDAQAAALHQELPKSLRSYEWVCVYDLVRNGASLPTLLQRSRDHSFTLFVIEDAAGGIFGGFAGDSWALGLSSGRFFGSGQCFVFTFQGGRDEFNSWREREVAADLAEEHAAIIATLREDLHSVPASPLIDRTAVAPEPPPLVIPGPASVLSVYRWARRNRYFQLAGPDGVGMGGGGSFSFWLDGDLCSGSSGLCGTYLSPCLSAEGDRFTAVRVELWALRRRTSLPL